MRPAAGLAAVLAMACASAHAQGPSPAPDPAASAEVEAGTFTLEIENDYFGFSGADRHYTTGTRLSWLSAPTAPERMPVWTSGPYTAWPIFAAEGTRRWGFAMGQNIYTPTDVDRDVPDPKDRPYAGWTYFAVSLNTETATRLDTLELDLGVVGPAAGGRKVQNGFHHLIGNPSSNGWDHQLKNEPGGMLIGERRWRLLPQTPLFGSSTLNTDIIGLVGASLGNVQTYGSAGAIFRIGGRLDRDFGPPHIRPSLPGSGTFKKTDGLNWYLFVGGEGRAVGHDIFLDGNTFDDDGPSVDKKHFVADAEVGFALTYGSMRTSFTQIYRTKEFKGQQGNDRFGSISFSWRF
jgi:hypothetical protein